MDKFDPLASPLQAERTERPWGWFATLAEWRGCKVKRICVLPGRQISLQCHRHRAEHWIVTCGIATVAVGDRVTDLCVGQHVDIAVGVVHRLANSTAQDLEIVELQLGDLLDEDDIERLQDDYGRV